MCLHDSLSTTTTAAAPRRRAFAWLSGLTLNWLARLWSRDDLAELNDFQRRDIGLPRRDRRPDAATLLDMSRPGSHRGGRHW